MTFRKELYPPDWEIISRRIRYGRADNRCERCGVSNGAVIVRNPDGSWDDYEQMRRDAVALGGEVVGRPITVVLTVAHLNHDPSDCRDENLLALCQLHHLQMDAQVHAQHAAETRRRRRIQAGQREMPGLTDPAAERTP